MAPRAPLHPPQVVPGRYARGFTLIELVAAATVLGLAATGAMALIGTGRAVSAEEILERQAYQYAAAALEREECHPKMYSAILIAGALWPAETRPLTLDGGATINATLTVSAGEESQRDFRDPPSTGTIPIPIRPITATVAWTPPSGSAKSISLLKYIADGY